jgi:hypothetical protein
VSDIFQRARLDLMLGASAVSLAAGAAVFLTRFAATDWFVFASIVAVLLGSTIGVLIYEGRVGKDAFSVLSLIAWFYLLAFGIGPIYYWISPNPADALFAFPRFNHDDLTKATAMAAAAWLLLVAGYAWNPLGILTRGVRPLKIEPTERRDAFAVIVSLLVVGWGARLGLVVTGHYFHVAVKGTGVVSTGYTWFLATFALLPTLATAYLGAASLGRTPRVVRRWPFWILVAMEFAWNLPSGARSGLVGLGLMIAVVGYYVRGKRIPWLAVATAGLILVFFVFPFVLQYRGQGGGYETNPRSALGQAVGNYGGLSATSMARRGIDATIGRFSDVASDAVVFDRGRQQMKLAPGETLLWGLEGFVPRALFPKKPDPGVFGNEFGQAFGLTFGPTSQGGTSVATGQPTELYLNFGMLGVIFGMPLVGALYRLMNDYLRTRQGDRGVLALYAVLAWPIIGGQEVILAVGLFGVIKAAILLTLSLLLLRKVLRVTPSVENPARLVPLG